MAFLTWVHLSDLHIEEKDTFNRSRVLGALYDDIKNRERFAPELEKINSLFFTGDMAYHGDQKEYDLATNEFVHPLLNTLEIQRGNLFIIPGNHDVNCATFQKYAVERSEKLNNGEKITESLEDVEDVELFGRRIANYTQALKKIAPHTNIQNPGWFCTADLFIGDKKITILCLNTAWLCTGSDKDKPCLGERQLAEALKKANDSDIVVALFHHPVGKWREIDDTQKCEILLQKHCALWFHGHTHLPDWPVSELSTEKCG